MKRKGNRQIRTGRPPGRPRTSDLVTFSVKIPRALQATLDKAASNSRDSRNMIIRRILEQYFSGELSRADLTPLDYGNSINFDAPATRREAPHLHPQEKLRYSE